MSDEIKVALDAKATLGEGAVWDAKNNRLLWIDIVEKRVGIFDPATGKNRMLQLDTSPGTVVPTTRGDLMVAVHEGFARLDPESGELSGLIVPPGHDATKVRFNDGKCDPAGRFWAGSMSLTFAPQAGTLYCLGTDGSARAMLSGVSISNGITWSHDRKRMYYIDTMNPSVDVFDYDDATGAIGNRRVAVSIPTTMGYPDGMTIDAEGKLWIALWDGFAVTRWDPDTGKLLKTIKLPVARPTSCAFGGPGLKTLYITSARMDLPESDLAAQPHAGAIFAVPSDIPGIPAFPYAG